MLTYVIAATVVAFLTGWVWYQYLFPHAGADLAGSEDAAKRMRGKTIILMVVVLLIVTAASGTFIKNRGVLDAVDVIKLAIKMWFGFFFPVSLAAWAQTKASLTTLVANVGYWLVAAVEFAVLADWFLLKVG
jgi:hypothetical protein